MSLYINTFFSETIIRIIAYSNTLKKIAGFINSNIKFQKDLAVKFPDNIIYSNSLDRILALNLLKFSTMGAFETKVISQKIKKGMVLYDIGANLGFYTLLFSKLTGLNGQVIAFEPDPDNFRLLKKNLIQNHISNVLAIQKAISNKTGKEKLYICEEHHGNHRIYITKEKRRWISVESTTLDHFLLGKPPPNFIKLDIEGAECLAIRGMLSTLKIVKHLIMICEFAPNNLWQSQCNPLFLLRTMNDLGFKRKLLNERTKQLESVSDSKLIQISYKEHYVNLLFEK
jgi:FkbM family methyltransferase